MSSPGVLGAGGPPHAALLSAAATDPYALLDPTPQNVFRGCVRCPQLTQELADVFFADTWDCMGGGAGTTPSEGAAAAGSPVPSSDAAQLVSCTILACLALHMLCGSEKLSLVNPAVSALLEWPRVFLDYHNRLVMERGKVVVAGLMMALVESFTPLLGRIMQRYSRGMSAEAKFGFAPDGFMEVPPGVVWGCIMG